MSYFRSKPLSLAVQLIYLKRRFPDGMGEVRRGRLIWYQRIQPHSLAHVYCCRLEHTFEEYPCVYCLEPALSVLSAGRRLPHVYTREEPICLCLFMRGRQSWHDGMILADVVVPLAFYWLASFEDWLFSGEWRGGGTHAIEPEAPSALPVFPSEISSTVSVPSRQRDAANMTSSSAAA